MTRLTLLGLVALMASGCCSTPTVAAGGNGVFARYVPVDPTNPKDIPASGSVDQHDVGWPPTAIPNDCSAASPKDELSALQAALGNSVACPAFQEATIPSSMEHDAAPPIGKPHPLEPRRDCFAQGDALIIVESRQREYPRCVHVVGIAVYPRAGGR